MQSNAHTTLPAGAKLAASKLATDIQQQLSQLIEADEFKSPMKGTAPKAESAKTKPGRVVLFCGEDVEQKLQAATAIGSELGSAVYKVDVSSVISRFISHTEKNLDRLFTKAARSGAILFFHEADELFGKRTEVKDAHDRYANQEANYLLAQAAAHGVVVIVSVKRRADIDKAFMRRLRFIVEF